MLRKAVVAVFVGIPIAAAALTLAVLLHGDSKSSRGRTGR